MVSSERVIRKMLGLQVDSNELSVKPNDAEKRELEILNTKLAKIQHQIAKIEKKKMAKIRQIAWRTGVAALKLKDLKSEYGGFVVQKERYGYQRALAIKKEGEYVVDHEGAYQCVNEFASLEEKGQTCGWVRGEPTKRKYDEIGPLSGSAGTEYFCRICHKHLGRFVEICL